MTVYELITKHEGRRKKPYKCSGGKNTIGIGWNFDDNPLPPYIAGYLAKHGEITDEMIDYLLDISVQRAIGDCQYLFPDFANFSINRQMALTDFVFQLGLKRASGFVNSIAMINTGRWEEAAKNMMKSRWATQTRKRAEEVTDLIAAG
ncbi:MAG: glycoside hydrolase family protein [Phycisphaerae bacterium]|nr:glycoside hydrolase family protein [Phycisphaerae bacterium]